MLGILLSDVVSYNRPVEQLKLPTATSQQPPPSQQSKPTCRTPSHLNKNATANSSSPPEGYAERRVQFFRRLPEFFPHLAFLLTYASMCMFDTLIDTLFAPLKMVWSRFAMRETLATFLVGCGVVCLVCAAPSESRLYSSVYHFVRASSVLKLYVVFNMLELADKVLSSFSTDIVEAAIEHWDNWYYPLEERNLKKERSSGIEVLLTLFVAAVSVVCHTAVLLMHIATLNVAINSEDSSLVGLLISNNFVELKSVIFKKYTGESLFTVVCTDALEWVQSFVFIGVMFLQHIQTEGLGSLEMFDIVMIVGCEMVIDALKHMFASRFNGMSLRVYKGYLEALMLDVAIRRFLGALDLPVYSTEPTVQGGRKPASLRSTSAYCRSVELVPNPAKRSAFSPFPYASIIIWAAWPVVRVMWTMSPLNVGLLVIVVVLVKVMLVSTTTGIATRYVCRTILRRQHKSSTTSTTPSSSSTFPIASSGSALSNMVPALSQSESRSTSPAPSINNTASTTSAGNPLVHHQLPQSAASSLFERRRNSGVRYNNSNIVVEESISRDIGRHAGTIGISPPAFCSTPSIAPGWATNQFLSTGGGGNGGMGVHALDPGSLSPYRPSTPSSSMKTASHQDQQRTTTTSYIDRHQQQQGARRCPRAPAFAIELDPFVDCLLTVDRFNLQAGKKKETTK